MYMKKKLFLMFLLASMGMLTSVYAALFEVKVTGLPKGYKLILWPEISIYNITKKANIKTQEGFSYTFDDDVTTHSALGSLSGLAMRVDSDIDNGELHLNYESLPDSLINKEGNKIGFRFLIEVIEFVDEKGHQVADNAYSVSVNGDYINDLSNVNIFFVSAFGPFLSEEIKIRIDSNNEQIEASDCLDENKSDK